MGSRRRTMMVGPLLAVIVAVAGVGLASRWTRAEAAPAAEPDPEAGRQIYQQDCAVCHGPEGQGSFRGPDISQSGPAAVDFMVSTGRMPVAEPRTNVPRSQPDYSPAQIRDLVAYTAELIDGPDVPEVDLADADTAEGGKLYRFNCASCHQAVGAGGALAYGVVAPPLRDATPTQTVEAMRTGPGTMPVFDAETFDDEEAASLAKYVDYLREPRDRGGLSLWHIGPVAEGMIALVVGLGAMVLFIRWLGTRSRLETE